MLNIYCVNPVGVFKSRSKHPQEFTYNQILKQIFIMKTSKLQFLVTVGSYRPENGCVP